MSIDKKGTPTKRKGSSAVGGRSEKLNEVEYSSPQFNKKGVALNASSNKRRRFEREQAVDRRQTYQQLTFEKAKNHSFSERSFEIDHKSQRSSSERQNTHEEYSQEIDFQSLLGKVSCICSGPNHRVNLEELNEIAFSELELITNRLQSSSLQPFARMQVGLIYTFKHQAILWKKYRNAVLNLTLIEHKASRHQQKFEKTKQQAQPVESLTLEERHKSYLLELLIKQLSRKIFINNLKFQLQRRKISNQRNRQIQEPSQARKISDQSFEQVSDYGNTLFVANEEKSQSQQLEFVEAEQSASSSQSQKKMLMAKLTIFQQNTSGVFKKRMFEAYTKIRNTVDSQEKSIENSSYEQQISNIQQSRPQQQVQESLSSQNDEIEQSNREPNQYQQYEQQYEQEGTNNGDGDSAINLEDEELRKMRELIYYISDVKKEARQCDSTLKRYFLRWKAFLLEKILEEYNEDEDQGISQGLAQGQESYSEQGDVVNVYHDDYSQEYSHDPNQLNYGPYTERQLTANAEEISQQAPHELIQSQFSDANGYLSSMKSSGMYSVGHSRQQFSPREKQLRHSKLTLQYFLYSKRISEFWECFSQNYTQKRLESVSLKLREERLAKNALMSLRKNVNLKRIERKNQPYYERVANGQNEEGTRLAQKVYLTNMKARYYFDFIETAKAMKMCKNLIKVTVRSAFTEIESTSAFQRRKQLAIHRHIETRYKKLIFRSFNAWSESTVRSAAYQRCREYKSKQQSQTVATCFSILLLSVKQSRIKEKRAKHFHRGKVSSKVFDYLRFLSDENRQIRQKASELKGFLLFKRGNVFMGKLEDYYADKVLQHRVIVKGNKLERYLQGDKVRDMIQKWRQQVVKKQSYRAIEYRLMRLRERQIKGQMLSIWQKELKARQGRGLNGTSVDSDGLDQSTQHKDWLVRYYGNLCQLVRH